MATKAEQDAIFQRLMDLGRGFQPDLYDVAGEVAVMLQALAEEIAQAIEAHRDEPWTLEQALSSTPNGVLSKAATIAREVGGIAQD